MTDTPNSDKVCTWTEDEDGNWETECGDAFTFNEGGPRTNGIRFCGYCGKRIKEVRFHERTEVRR